MNGSRSVIFYAKCQILKLKCYNFIRTIRPFHLRGGSELTDCEEHTFGDLCGHRRGASARQGSGHVWQDRSYGALQAKGQSSVFFYLCSCLGNLLDTMLQSHCTSVKFVKSQLIGWFVTNCFVYSEPSSSKVSVWMQAGVLVFLLLL